MPKALITGVTGQDGSYLAEFLLDKGYEVYGAARRTSTPILWRIEHILDRIELVSADLSDLGSLIRLIEEIQPDEVYNLAAQSFVSTSWNQPLLTAETTGIGVLKMLEARQADIIMGSRLRGTIESGAMSRKNYIGNKLLTMTANMFFSRGNKISDLCTGLWGFNDDAISTLAYNLEADDFDIEAEMYVKARKHGFSFKEIPIFYANRGGATKLTSFRHGKVIMRRLLHELW